MHTKIPSNNKKKIRAKDDMHNMVYRFWVQFFLKGIVHEKIFIYKANSHSYEKFDRISPANSMLENFYNLL